MEQTTSVKKDELLKQNNSPRGKDALLFSGPVKFVYKVLVEADMAEQFDLFVEDGGHDYLNVWCRKEFVVSAKENLNDIVNFT